MINRSGKEYLKQKVCMCETESLLYSKDWHRTVNQPLQFKKKKDTRMAESQSPLPIPHDVTPSQRGQTESALLSLTLVDTRAKRLNVYCDRG